MREARIEAERLQRRRRQPGSLNRMVTSNFGIPEECKDPAYHYHWVNDVRGRIQMLTTQDDYEVVTLADLEATAKAKRADFELDRNGYGLGGRVEVPAERDGTKAVLLRKPLDFYEYDYNEACESRQAMMEQRVYEGRGFDGESPDGRAESLDEQNVYVPKDNTLGATARRRGRIPQRLK